MPRPMPNEGRRFRWLLLLAAVVIAMLFALGVNIHRVGMDWAASELRAYYSGTRRGIAGSLLSMSTIEEWARFHRDALVKRGRLVHRNYRFDIASPSPKESRLTLTVMLSPPAKSETIFTTFGASPRGTFCEVNLWCDPRQVEAWDAWYAEQSR